MKIRSDQIETTHRNHELRCAQVDGRRRGVFQLRENHRRYLLSGERFVLLAVCNLFISCGRPNAALLTAG